MNNKSKTGLFKTALKKGLLFSKTTTALVHDYPVRKPMKKKKHESEILYILLNRVPDTQE